MRTSNPVISRSTTECAECTGVSRHGDVEQDDYRGQPGLLGRTETNPKTSAKTFDEVCVDAFRESARGRGTRTWSLRTPSGCFCRAGRLIELVLMIAAPSGRCANAALVTWKKLSMFTAKVRRHCSSLIGEVSFGC